MMVTRTQAGCGRATARFNIAPQKSPPHAESEQRGKRQNGQESIGYAHVV
jgi:hypothetical protein